ncbi:hypothetical protein HPP92_001252 [Vanilla planifolia]|uniref:Uncharacterized protein n=1 Tax=Vanilla planifolia TaxID=51239 RepID=A0A835RXU3_VANPL|nr:hypothetical protein HPP92_001252 [Vanilla planifolia]
MPQPGVHHHPETSPSAAPLLPTADGSYHDYYSVRQAFLRSYTFSARESLGERLRRRWRELGERGREALSRAADMVLDELFETRRGRRVVARTLRCRITGLVFHPMRCFAAR